jgi:dTDP-D-glucose 4,6-dehydratase
VWGRGGEQTNVLGTHTLLECARRWGVKRFIHVSTDEVYGDVLGAGATETAALEPTNPYSCSKARARTEGICAG